MKITLTRPDRTARAEVTRLSDEHYRVFGHVCGTPLGQDGRGREYRGENAKHVAMRVAVELVYGQRAPRFGEYTMRRVG